MKNYLTAILFPTEDLTQLLMMQSSLVTNDNEYTPHYIKLHKYKSQYIYISSKRKIKDGDWKYCSFTEAVTKYDPLAKIPGTGTCEDCRKIEFTNDPKLIADGVPELPKTSNSGGAEVKFLEEFVKRYMKKTVNDEVGQMPAYETGLTAEESEYLGIEIEMWCELEDVNVDDEIYITSWHKFNQAHYEHDCRNADIKLNDNGEAVIYFGQCT